MLQLKNEPQQGQKNIFVLMITPIAYNKLTKVKMN
jgi:hypothetical protein